MDNGDGFKSTFPTQDVEGYPIDFDVFYTNESSPTNLVSIDSCIQDALPLLQEATVASCIMSAGDGKQCDKSHNGIYEESSWAKGWQYKADGEGQAAFLFDAENNINHLHMHNAVGGRNHEPTEFDIFYTTSSNPTIDGNEWIALSGVSFGNTVAGGAISGNTITCDGQTVLEIGFDAVDATAIKLHVKKSTAGNDNIVLTEIDFFKTVIEPQDCDTAYDGTTTKNRHDKGWSYGSAASGQAAFIFDAENNIDRLNMISALGESGTPPDNAPTDFDIFYTTSSNPTIDGNEWIALSGVSFGNTVAGGAISGNTITCDGQNLLEIKFDAVDATAIKLHVKGGTADNIILNEIQFFESYWKPVTGLSFNNAVAGGAIDGNHVTTTGQLLYELNFDSTQATAIMLYIRDALHSQNNMVLTELSVAGVDYSTYAEESSFSLEMNDVTVADVEASIDTYRQDFAKSLNVSISQVHVAVEASARRRLTGGVVLTVTVTSLTTSDASSIQVAIQAPAFVASVATQLGVAASAVTVDLISTCTVTCAFTNVVSVTHDTASQHTHHRCYVDDTSSPSACKCTCCDSENTDCSIDANYLA
jgi:hypothetical protein